MMIAIPYGRGYTSQFVFDPASGHYRRFSEGQRSVDVLTGHQIEVAAVIVLYARWWQGYEGPVLPRRTALTGGGRMPVSPAGRRPVRTLPRPHSLQRILLPHPHGR